MYFDVHSEFDSKYEGRIDASTCAYDNDCLTGDSHQNIRWREYQKRSKNKNNERTLSTVKLFKLSVNTV